MNPLLNTPRIITVKLYHVQCSNEPMSLRLLSGYAEMPVYAVAGAELSCPVKRTFVRPNGSLCGDGKSCIWSAGNKGKSRKQ